ncbi:MAG: hypothetical protein PUB20_01020 [Clostridia bacterium]|nr:hypothetical protein [Clostridia bacterium]
MDERSKVKNELIEKLKTISEDKDFLLSVINSVKSMNDRKAIIEYIDRGEEVTYENLILLSLSIYELREEDKD